MLMQVQVQKYKLQPDGKIVQLWFLKFIHMIQHYSS